MSATSDCSCSCDSPVVVSVPGTEGDAGGAGTDGISAFTVTDGVAGPFDAGDTGITITVADSSMFSVGQYVAIEDVNTDDPGFFKITALAANQLTLTYLDIAVNTDGKSIATAKAVSPSGPPFTLGALPTAFTDNSTGTASDTIAAGVGVFTLSIPISLAQISGAGDVLTTLTPGFKFKILAVDAFVKVAVTTAAKAATLNIEIGSTNLTGGAVALTSANCTPLGALIAGSAVTAANTGTAADTISVEASSVTAFSEGEVILMVRIQNMDTADAVASLADHINDLINTTLA